MRNKFNPASEGLQIIDLNSLKKSPKKSGLFKQALAILDRRYPEFAGDTLDVQRRDGGYLNIALAGDRVVGFATGNILEKEGAAFKTALLTYMTTVDDETGVAARKKLMDETKERLEKQGVKAIYVELFRPGKEGNTARDAEDRNIYGQLGLQRVPLSNYQQPVSEEGESRVQTYDLYGAFSDGMTDRQKREATVQHIESFARLYDENLEAPENQSDLGIYDRELAKASWKPVPVSGPSVKL